MRAIPVFAFLLLSAGPALAQKPEDQAVAVVRRMFDAMKVRDTTTMKSTVAPDARLIGTGTRGAPYRVIGMGTFISAIGRTPNADERIYEPEVRVDQNLATVWTRYDLFVGDALLHCGYDAFQLIRTKGEWKIAQIADTQRQGAALCGRGAAPTAPPQPTAADTAAIVAALQRVFDGMRTKDTLVLKDAFVPEGQLIGIRDENTEWHPLRADAWASQLARSQRPGALNERMYSPEVRISDNLATVWTWYDFHIGESFSHCGFDAAQLVRTAAGWKVIQITYTVRTSPCNRPARD